MKFTAPEGLNFAGWNTAADGSGTQYTDMAKVKDLAEAGGEITLYAQWLENAGEDHRGCATKNPRKWV